jgi:acyl-CoA hydrolase
MMETQRRDVTLRFLAQPVDVNFGGKVHGGSVMRWIDQAGYACAVGWSGHYCVTVYVGGIRFYKPIPVGSLVEVEAKIIYTGKTSMHVAVDVRAGDLKDQAFARTTHCMIVFVSVNDHGNPTPVRPWAPQTKSEVAEQEYALRLMEIRKGIEGEASEIQP